MSDGKVKVWYMTEEERLAYIEKHPIVPSDDSPLATVRVVSKFHNPEYAKRSKESRALTQTRMTDGINKAEVHKRFMKGEKLEAIAAALNITSITLNRFIRDQRQVEPEKWPSRNKNRKKSVAQE